LASCASWVRGRVGCLVVPVRVDPPGAGEHAAVRSWTIAVSLGVMPGRLARTGKCETRPPFMGEAGSSGAVSLPKVMPARC
jgi:hypothetical protein